MTTFDAWCAGYGAAVRGFSRVANPYRGRKAAAWLAGFEDAVLEGKWGTYTP